MEIQQATLNQSFGLACKPIGDTAESICRFELHEGDDLVAILFDQLSYLVRYPEEERERLEQVTKILMAPFCETHRNYPPREVP